MNHNRCLCVIEMTDNGKATTAKFREVKEKIEAKYKKTTKEFEAAITNDAILIEARVLMKEMQDSNQQCLCKPPCGSPPKEGNGFCQPMRHAAMQRLIKSVSQSYIRAEVKAEWAKLRAK